MLMVYIRGSVGVSSRNNNKRDIVGSAVRIPQHFEEVVMESNNAAGLVDGLVDDVQKNLNFRDESARVGAVYTMSYQLATVATYDYDREQAGGLPKGGFLVAAEPQGDNGFILLRILKEARLPNADANDQTRQQAIEKTGNEEPWANALDTWMANQVSLHGIECRILGTFIDQGDGTVRFAEDTDNYFAVTSLMVWKPGPRTLDKIVNYRHRRNALAPSDRKQVGNTRFAAAEGGSGDPRSVSPRSDRPSTATHRLPRHVAIRQIQRDEDHGGGDLSSSRNRAGCSDRPVDLRSQRRICPGQSPGRAGSAQDSRGGRLATARTKSRLTGSLQLPLPILIARS